MHGLGILGNRQLLPLNTKHLYNIYTMLDQRRRRGADGVKNVIQMFCVYWADAIPARARTWGSDYVCLLPKLGKRGTECQFSMHSFCCDRGGGGVIGAVVKARKLKFEPHSGFQTARARISNPVMFLGGNVISFISPSSGSSPGPVYPICTERWPKTPFISFHFCCDGNCKFCV